jgi:glycosyltransferase involved in cell wall biosynthesis
LNRFLDLKVVFTSEKSSVRNNDFFNGVRQFEHQSLDGKGLLESVMVITKLIRKHQKAEVILCGWDQALFWVIAFINPKRCNAIVIESSIYESKTAGLKGLVKRLFLSRVTKAYCSGKAQEAILKSLNYKGKVVITKGVGIFNIIPQPAFKKEEKAVIDFVYIGRFSEEKNLFFLLSFFNLNENLNLHLVGFGPLECDLKVNANKNIIFHGAVANHELAPLIQQFQVLVLPSNSEPWGLVVEEALNNGLPVIVSDRVGCLDEVVTPAVGLSFKLDDMEEFNNAIATITNLNFYNQLRLNISKLDFDKIAAQQVKSYL